jgi:hypothetical protein
MKDCPLLKFQLKFEPFTSIVCASAKHNKEIVRIKKINVIAKICLVISSTHHLQQIPEGSEGCNWRYYCVN